MNFESRISRKLNFLQEKNEKGLVAYIMAGDPNYDTSLEIFKRMGDVGVDLIELGMPFSDPMADGQTIQNAGLRSLAGGHKMKKTFEMVREFRQNNDHTPIVLMGYYNVVYQYGRENFIKDAKEAGVDGCLIVDLPMEEDLELCVPCLEEEFDFIKLISPQTNEERINKVLTNSSGFVYYVSVCGTTGGKEANLEEVKEKVEIIKKHTNLPVGVGFGINSGEKAKQFSKISDVVIVGSAIIKKIEDTYENGLDTVESTIDFVRELVNAVKEK